MDSADLDLIQRELDGENSPDEQERLAALLEEDADAQKAFDELKMVSTELENLSLVEPPQQFWGSVMEAIEDRQRARRSSLRDVIRDLLSALSARPVLAYGYTFAMGLVVGVALFAVLSGNRASEEDLFGTLVSESELADTAEAYESTLDLPGFAAILKVYATNALVIVDLDADAETATEVRMVADGSLALKGLTRRGMGSTPAFQAVDDRIEFSVSGEDRYTVMFGRPSGSIPPIRFELWREGERLHTEDVRFAP